jgi:hypothetical protein
VAHGGAVCVACGIHLEGILPEELASVHTLAEDLAARFMAEL